MLAGTVSISYVLQKFVKTNNSCPVCEGELNTSSLADTNVKEVFILDFLKSSSAAFLNCPIDPGEEQTNSVRKMIQEIVSSQQTATFNLFSQQLNSMVVSNFNQQFKNLTLHSNATPSTMAPPLAQTSLDELLNIGPNIVSSRCNHSNIRPEKASLIMSKWKLKCMGGRTGLLVESFMTVAYLIRIS